MSSNEVIKLINGFGLMERLMIVEEILRTIRKETITPTSQEHASDNKSAPPILGLSGIIDDAEANVLTSAVEESRKIDHDGW